MKLSASTLDVLKNFSTINNALFFRQGNVLRTINQHKNLIGSASITETIPKDFALYDLSRFIALISLFDDPDIQFADEGILISQGGHSTKFAYAHESVVLKGPDKDISLPHKNIEFKLDVATINKIQKAGALISVDDISFIGKGGELTVAVKDIKGKGPNSYHVAVGKVESKNDFSFDFKLENFKMLPVDYDVSVTVTEKGILCQFDGKQANGAVLRYWVSCESTTKYTG